MAKYAFMREHLGEFKLTAMCRVLGVNRASVQLRARTGLGISGFYLLLNELWTVPVRGGAPTECHADNFSCQ